MGKQFNRKTIVVGCNYHLRKQSSPSMRFVLKEVKGNKARLVTRTTNNDFWVDKSELIFITTEYNINKAKRLLRERKRK